MTETKVKTNHAGRVHKQTTCQVLP